MKTLKLKILILILSVAVLTSFVSCKLFVPQDPMIFTGDPKEEFLGVPWGCSFEELQDILDKAPLKTKFHKAAANTPRWEVYSYRWNHQLPKASYTFFSFSEKKLDSIEVFFFTDNEDDAKYIFDWLKKEIKKELEDIVLDYLSGTKDKKNGRRNIFGYKENMSFKLAYGGNLIDGSNEEVILSAEIDRYYKK